MTACACSRDEETSTCSITALIVYETYEYMSVYEKFGARMISEDKFLPAGGGPAPRAPLRGARARPRARTRSAKCRLTCGAAGIYRGSISASVLSRASAIGSKQCAVAVRPERRTAA